MTFDNNRDMITAFESFHQAYFGNVTKHLSAMLNAQEAEEIAQEAFIKIYLKAKTQDDVSNYTEYFYQQRGLLFACAHNLAISKLRHLQVRSEYHLQCQYEQTVAVADIEASYFADIEQQRIVDAINQLPPICRQVFVQRRLYNRSHQEISEMLGISIKTVENHLARGLKLCRDWLSHGSNLANNLRKTG